MLSLRTAAAVATFAVCTATLPAVVPPSVQPIVATAPAAAAAPRERLNFDAGWRFALGHATDPAKDFDFATAYFSYVTKAGYGDGPASPKFDDRAWRQLDLPHDWAVEAPFAANGSHSHGYKAIGRNFPERSVGWYRKTFTVPAADAGRRIGIEFDGVFRDSQVWVNGFFLGRQASGYMGFRYDLTDYLKYDAENVIVVRADATLEEGWYYEGAGIYRHVWLTKTAPVHVARWGTFVSAEVSPDFAAAQVKVETTVANDGTRAADLVLEHAILDPDGREIGRQSAAALTLAAGRQSAVSQTLAVVQPRLWSLEEPNLYRLVTTARSAGAVVDRYETAFGIRTLRFDANEGFFLNGKHVVIKGTNNHQDHAGVGVALPDSLWEFRMRRLKEMGNNALRCSHNPPAPELLDVCDRLGILVLDENRLMGTNAAQLDELTAMIRRDRNHPSIFLWSLGNEEWAIEGNEFGARVTATMRAFAERLDPSRRTTVAISGGWGAGSSTTTDVMGYNYYTHGSTDEQHAKFPDQPSLGTEETTAQCTRGIYFTDAARAHQAHNPTLIGDSGANCIAGWKHFAARPYLAGLFFWTGFDYRGESNPYSFPAVSSQYGLVDTCGFPKDSFYYLQAMWTAQPVLHVYPHWNWNGREGETITVGTYTNHEEVELLLNGRSLGRKAVPQYDRVEWSVPYEPGVVEARGFRGGKLVDTTRVETTGPATRLVLTPDRPTLTADGTDATVFAVEARDAQGRFVPTANLPVRFSIAGGEILGVGNGDPSCHEPDRFLPTLANTGLENWRGRIVAPGVTPATEEEMRSLVAVGDWKAPLPKEGELYELAADFSAGDLPAGVSIELFLPAFGTRTTVWLNGIELARDLDTATAGPALTLTAAQLANGANRVRVLVTPFPDWQRRRLPQLTRLGTLRVTTPAPQAQRSLFNGLAQVIVQAPATAGTLRLTAEADGLAAASSVIEVK
ncbi:MAG TPA: beta-galactosidase GalA [Opitutaceae bacterium]|nr:beta-galactosidase GalA [Opitutaceae bacterium]